MKPAAFAALLNNDLANFLVASTPGGIERQEKSGQVAFVNSATLPLDTNRSCTWEQLAELGIVKGAAIDDLFVSVTLPPGWTKRPSEHSMWSHLLDEQGRERAAIFYKAAFYDRSAHLSLNRRYAYCTQPIISDDYRGPRRGVVLDGGTIIWQTEGQAESRDFTLCDELEAQARAWLEEHSRTGAIP